LYCKSLSGKGEGGRFCEPPVLQMHHSAHLARRICILFSKSNLRTLRTSGESHVCLRFAIRLFPRSA